MATRLNPERWHLLRPYLDRRQQILWAATEADVVGCGGRALLHDLTGISVSAISARMRDIGHTKAAIAGSLAHHPPYARGRKLFEVVDPNIEPALEKCCRMKLPATD